MPCCRNRSPELCAGYRRHWLGAAKVSGGDAIIGPCLVWWASGCCCSSTGFAGHWRGGRLLLLWLARVRGGRRGGVHASQTRDSSQRSAVRVSVLLSVTNPQNVAYWAALGECNGGRSACMSRPLPTSASFAGFMVSSVVWAFVCAAIVDRLSPACKRPVGEADHRPDGRGAGAWHPARSRRTRKSRNSGGDLPGSKACRSVTIFLNFSSEIAIPCGLNGTFGQVDVRSNPLLSPAPERISTKS